MQNTVLIADDDVDTIEMTKGLLAFYGYDVFGVYDGQEVSNRKANKSSRYFA
jgi:CheY-like chemotaxis protein